MPTKRRDPQELKAMAFTRADEIETRAQDYITRGLSRDRAIQIAILEMSGHLTIVKG